MPFSSRIWNLNTTLTDVKTLVVKIGTSLLSSEKGFDGRVMECVVKDLVALKQARHLNILIVSSGAIGCGMAALGMKERPKVLPLKQATAAVGQSRLMHFYETLFQTYGEGLRTAQVLLTAAELDNRKTYLNIRNTVHTLFDMGNVIPIINENDSVSTEELKFGDNDTLAAKVAAKINADLLVLLSDVDGLFDMNPTVYPEAQLIPLVETVTEEIEKLAGDTRAQTSIGGMKTKLLAAKIACAAGLSMVIANGRRPYIVADILAGKAPCTMFGSSEATLSNRKRWIAFGRSAKGSIIVDAGACRALIEQGKSLLAAGVKEVSGHFEMGSAVQIADTAQRPIAAGLVNYSSADIDRIKGCKSSEIQSILGRKDFDEVIHRDNLVLL
ncbi:MAG: glutamate 5-kinase [Candidatus Hydrogenedentes bacterium]|nr:glutamate 5-kinase [Candidatus Hydrogenedentota bacterium]